MSSVISTYCTAFRTTTLALSRPSAQSKGALARFRDEGRPQLSICSEEDFPTATDYTHGKTTFHHADRRHILWLPFKAFPSSVTLTMQTIQTIQTETRAMNSYMIFLNTCSLADPGNTAHHCTSTLSDSSEAASEIAWLDQERDSKQRTSLNLDFAH